LKEVYKLVDEVFICLTITVAATIMVVVGHAAHALRSPFGSLHTIVAAREYD